MYTGGENSLILIKLYIYVQVFYMVKKKKKKNSDLSTHFFSGMLPETFFFFFLALCFRKQDIFFWPNQPQNIEKQITLSKRHTQIEPARLIWLVDLSS